MAGVDETIFEKDMDNNFQHREEDSVNVIIRNLERGIDNASLRVFGSQSGLDVNVCALEAFVRVFAGEFQSSNKLNVTCHYISIDDDDPT